LDRLAANNGHWGRVGKLPIFNPLDDFREPPRDCPITYAHASDKATFSLHSVDGTSGEAGKPANFGEANQGLHCVHHLLRWNKRETLCQKKAWVERYSFVSMLLTTLDQ
jgi:hypothetical protein